MEFLLKYASKSEGEIFQELKTSPDGISSDEATKRLRENGPNKIQSFQIDLIEIIKRNSLNFFNLFLLTATLLSFLTEGLKIEPILIFIFLLLSILISIFQDYRANKLTQKLLDYFKSYSFVKRDGRWQRLDSEEIIPGDYVKVAAGSIVPADIRILKCEETLIDESILTGESEPIFKSPNYLENQNKTTVPSNIALMGTTIVKGEIEGVVFATSKNSYFGSLAKKTLEIKKETAYQKMMDNFAKSIGYFAIVVGLLIIFLKIIFANYENFQELIIFVIVLLVAIVPEFLPTMTILTMSLAGIRLARQGLIIKRLSAIEDLGAIEVLCTDKTGTITTNQLTLIKIITNPENEELNTQIESEFIKYFLLDYYFSQEKSTYEEAILKKIEKLPNYENIEFLEDTEFDPNQRIKKLFIKENNQEIEVIKGAPEEVIKIILNNNENLKNKWLNIFIANDKSGFRTLALGLKRKSDENWVGDFLGIAVFEDPLKETSKAAIRLAQALNLDIKILTGDSINVARNVAQQLNLITKDEKVYSSEDLRSLSQEEFEKVVRESKVFARILPDDKLRIIETLQKEKYVGFLGEGINDALALKAVNVALVVDSAADVTKQEADIILKEKDLKIIVEGISQGRKTLENIGKYIKHTMSDNFGNLTSIAILTSFLKYVPLTPIQVLLTNFLTDIPLIAFATDNVSLKEIRKPIKMSGYHLTLLLLVLGLIAGIINIIGFILVKNQSIEVVRTYIFLLTTLTGLLVSFSIRSKNWFFSSKPSPFFFFISLIAIIISIIFVFNQYLAQIFGFAHLNGKLLSNMIILLIIFFITTEVVKKLFYKKFPEVI